jgi:hypothetical protein
VRVAKKRVVRQHEVEADFRVPQLAKAGSSLTLRLHYRGERIGEIEIGRGSLYWRGGGRHRSKRIPWSRFAEKMDELAYGE